MNAADGVSREKEENMAGTGQTIVYFKCDRSVEVQSQDVHVKDVGNVRCQDSIIQAKMAALKIYHFPKEGPKRCVISVLKIIEQMENTCPGINVQPMGETDVLIEWISVNRHKGWQQWMKAALVCLISFFGTGFTIMAYHNDVGINEVFTEVYKMIMNREPTGLNPLEVSYSVGLALGIVLFFNHVGGRRITKDPTPIEVALRNYEEDVDKALIATAAREGKEKENS